MKPLFQVLKALDRPVMSWLSSLDLAGIVFAILAGVLVAAFIAF